MSQIWPYVLYFTLGVIPAVIKMRGRTREKRLMRPGHARRGRRAVHTTAVLGGFAFVSLLIFGSVQTGHAAAAEEDLYKAKGWPAASVPNPSSPEGARKCNRHTVLRGSAVCDPDGLLTASAADKVEELIDAARKDISIPVASLGGERRPVQIAVLVVNKMATGSNGRRQIARDYAKDVHDFWGVGDAKAGTGVLLFLSKADRMVYISTGDVARERLTDRECDKVIETMIPLLRSSRYDLAVQKGVQGIVKSLAGPRTWWDRHGGKVLLASGAAFVGYKAWSSYHRSRAVREQWAGASRALQILEQRQGEAQEALRLDGHTNWQCPICLEDFPYNAPATAPAQMRTSTGYQFGAAADGAAPAKVAQLAASSADAASACAQDASHVNEDALLGGGRGGMGSRVLRCGHRFCLPCINDWTAVKSLCPVCRDPVPSAQPPPSGGSQVDLAGPGAQVDMASTGAGDVEAAAARRRNDLLFRLSSLQRRFPLVVSDELLRSGRRE